VFPFPAYLFAVEIDGRGGRRLISPDPSVGQQETRRGYVAGGSGHNYKGDLGKYAA